MPRTFIETPEFTKAWNDLGLNDDDLRELQNRLLADPDAGDLIQETGGIRKIRVSCKGHGKRGGARVLYVDIVPKEKIYMLNVYAKNQKEDISSQEKRVLAILVGMLRRE